MGKRLSQKKLNKLQLTYLFFFFSLLFNLGTNPISTIELKADEDGIIELRSELERIRIEKEHIQRRLKRNTLIMTNYDKQIGPIDQIYAHNVEAIGNLYNNAKEKHAKGIDVLKNNFDYHPLYSKGRKNEMRGIPFTPK